MCIKTVKGECQLLDDVDEGTSILQNVGNYMYRYQSIRRNEPKKLDVFVRLLTVGKL